MSPNKKTALEDLINKLEEKEYIVKSKSEWASSIHLVLKADRKTWRMVVDYRLINKRTARDSYPIPRMKELLYELSGKRYYSVIDLEMGFYNLKLSKESRKYTAFNCHLGLYEWTVLPMGFTNAPAEFQRVMDAILGHLYKKGVYCYIDDIIIATMTEESNLELIKEVVNALNLANDQHIWGFGYLTHC